MFLKIKLVFTEFTFPVVYTAKASSVKMVVSLYVHSHCVISKTKLSLLQKKIHIIKTR